MPNSSHEVFPVTAPRRDFFKRSVALTAGAAVAGPLSMAGIAHAAGSDQIKIALVGAGGRGAGAAVNALQNAAHKNVKLVAIADAFSDRLESSLRAILSQCPGQVDVPEDRRFVGLDAFEKAIRSDVDLVLLCSPPGFRPIHFEAAVRAGKNVFMEKPVAVDAPGYRRIQSANAEATKKGLAVAVGHHLRHTPSYREIVKEIHGGRVGELMFMRVYFNTEGIWVRPRKPDQTEMQYQVNNWYHFVWLSGDHIVEQHVHDLDVGNWMAQGHPVEANGMGGRQVRVAPGIGEIFDHHTVEFTYANGLKMFSQCRQIPNCWGSFAQHAHGTKGYADMDGGGQAKLSVAGAPAKQWKSQPDGHQVEMDDLFAAILAGKRYNEAGWAADSTMTAILGRMATYSGKLVSWEEASRSELNLLPERLAWEAEPKSKPGADGIYVCAIPGVTRAW